MSGVVGGVVGGVARHAVGLRKRYLVGSSAEIGDATYTEAAMTHTDGEPHKIHYTRVGLETLGFLCRYWRVMQGT